jgi:hypothetical protein
MARSGRVASRGVLSDHVSIAVWRVSPADVVDSVIQRPWSGEQRSRLLSARLMVYYVMSLALFTPGSYEEVMRSLLAGLEWVTGRFRVWQMPTKASIFKARTPAGLTVMAQLFAAVAKLLAALGGPGFYRSSRLVSVDGTCLYLWTGLAYICGQVGDRTRVPPSGHCDGIQERVPAGEGERSGRMRHTCGVLRRGLRLFRLRTRPVSAPAGRSGCRRLLRTCYLAALSSLKNSPASRTYDDRKRGEGGAHNQALIALARRCINVLWAMLRDHAPFTRNQCHASALKQLDKNIEIPSARERRDRQLQEGAC